MFSSSRMKMKNMIILGPFFFYEKQQCYILNKDLKGTKEGWEILLKQRTKQMEPPKY